MTRDNLITCAFSCKCTSVLSDINVFDVDYELKCTELSLCTSIQLVNVMGR